MAMAKYRVCMEYYSEGESGQDCYNFTDEDVAKAKMEEIKQAIINNFTGEVGCEVIDEEDFYGILHHKTGDFAKVILTQIGH